MRRWSFVILIVLLAAVVWWFFPTDERRIRAACRDIADTLTVPPTEADIDRVMRSARLAKHLTLDIVIEAEGLDQRLDGRDIVVGVAGRIASLPGLTVSLGDIAITVEEQPAGELVATVKTTATVRRAAASGSTEDVESRDVSMTWRKTPDGWQLSHAVITELRAITPQ